MFRFYFQILIIGICALLYSLAFNSFLAPHNLSSGGVTGIAFFINHFSNINTGLIVFALNIPLFIFGWIYLGRKFVLLTIYGVTIMSLGMKFFPVEAVSPDILLSSVIGGAICGTSVGILIRYGGSTGGIDIISLIFSKIKDMQVGFISTLINMIVVGVSGLIFGWGITLYTIIAIYVAGRAVDMVYTNQNKLTLTIVTDKYDELNEALIRLHSRGITITEAEGGFSHKPKKVLTTVITKFELSETKQTIRGIDSNAFVNITQTLEVMGRFRRD